MRKLMLAAALLLPACATATPAPGEPSGACRNQDLERFVGQPATADVGAQMLAASGARALRWVGFGMMVTMDFSPDRLTVRLSKDNRIESASCG